MTIEVHCPEIPWKRKQKQSHEVFNVTYKYSRRRAAVDFLTVHKSDLATTVMQKKPNYFWSPFNRVISCFV